MKRDHNRRPKLIDHTMGPNTYIFSLKEGRIDGKMKMRIMHQSSKIGSYLEIKSRKTEGWITFVQLVIKHFFDIPYLFLCVDGNRVMILMKI